MIDTSEKLFHLGKMDGGPVEKKTRFTRMNDKDKTLEKAIDSMFFKTAKYNSKTGRSTQTFVCYECHHTTWKVSNMRNHVRRHIKLKPFKCEGCNRGFAQSG